MPRLNRASTVALVVFGRSIGVSAQAPPTITVAGVAAKDSRRPAEASVAITHSNTEQVSSVTQVQKFTWLAVDPVAGSLDLAFHDRRGRPFTHHTVAIGGCERSAFVGDYNGLDAHGGRVVAGFPVSSGDGEPVLAAVAAFRTGAQDQG
jgi:hypothetical protein